ncbi:MAG: hypothetical protein IT353_10570 [Gemmatimonadaceae bacterium]|nr:hypothetical protein [Gemmatimonadaceae bacterium]
MNSAHRLRGWRLGVVCLLSTGSALGTFTSALRAQNMAPAVAEILDRLPDASAREAVRGALEEANARGLPSAPLVTKVREGLAKGAAPQRISAATIALGKRLATASAALAPAHSVDELVAGADVLQVGIAEATLREMRRIWPAKALTVPLGVLAELVASGVPPVKATSRVRELLTRGASTTQLAALSNTVRADVAAGLAPDAALELRSKGVLSLLASPTSNALTASPTSPTPTTGIRPPL